MPDNIDTQRRAWITTPLPDGRLVLEAISAHESLGSPFACDVSLVSLDPEVDLDALLGQTMTVHLLLTAGERLFSGIVVHAEHGIAEGSYTRYRVTLCPWLSLLQHTSNCRIFQDQSVVEIVKTIFRDNGFSDFEDALTGTYDSLEYCVQFCETDFNFVSRLLEREGIYYFFKHTDKIHTLVLADGYGAHKPTDGYSEIPYKPYQGRRNDECLTSWLVVKQVLPGAFSSTDFDFKNPKGSLLSQLKADLGNVAQSYALFDYPGRFLTASAGERRVQMRLQEAQVFYEKVTTSGNTRGLSAGALFSLADFPRTDQNKEYLVVSANYHFDVGDIIPGSSAVESMFDGNYGVIDSQTQFRPGFYAEKPRIEGPQTAIVVGPAGEEIWTDKYGRVKVQFHWDRYGASNEDSSCWVRVSQAWAGAKWGSMHIPRIGQEVIVDFLEGDPDRPIITGRVYNDDQMPPYDLPDNKTQSGIKSRSTPKGGPSNFNEIRFEDKKGSEELFIQAEKNKTVKVKHDRSASIGGSDSVSVGGDRSLSVDGNLSVTVKGGGQSAVHSTVSVTGKHGLHASDTIEVDAPTHIQLKCGDSIILIEPGKITLQAGGKAQIVLDANVFAKANGGAQVVLDPNVLVKSNAGSQVVLDANAAAKSSGGSEVVLDGNALVKAAGGGNVTVDGTKIQVAGQAEVNISAGSGSVKASGPGVEISGAMVKVNG